jgi:hypothetical protein
MNEELKQKLLSYLERLEGGIENAVEWSSKQAPLVIQELLEWEFVGNSIDAAFGVLLSGLMAVIIWKMPDVNVVEGVYEKRVTNYKNLFRAFAGIAAVTISCSLTLPSIKAAVKAKLAPRMVVIEKIRDAIK